MLLGDHGAQVTKVEPPGGDPFRSLSGYQVWNRGKRSIVVDLKTDERTASAWPGWPPGPTSSSKASRRASPSASVSTTPPCRPSILGSSPARSPATASTGASRRPPGDRRPGVGPHRPPVGGPGRAWAGPSAGWPAPRAMMPGLEAPPTGAGSAPSATARCSRGSPGRAWPPSTWPRWPSAPPSGSGASPGEASTWRPRSCKARCARRSAPGSGSRSPTRRISRPGSSIPGRPRASSGAPTGAGPITGSRCPVSCSACRAATISRLRRERSRPAGRVRGSPLSPRTWCCCTTTPRSWPKPSARFPSEEWVRSPARSACRVQPVRSPEEALLDPLFVDDGCVCEVDDPELGPVRQVGRVYRAVTRGPIRRRRSPPPRPGQHTEEILAGLLEPVRR